MEAQSVEGSRFKGECRKQTKRKSILVQVSTTFEFTKGLELSDANGLSLKQRRVKATDKQILHPLTSRMIPQQDKLSRTLRKYFLHHLITT